MTTTVLTKPAKVLFSGKTHITAGPNGAAVSRDGFLDVKLPEPHPAAENLFGAAWSACYIGAIQLAAAQKKVKLPALPEVDAEIDLHHAGGTNFFLSARLDVSLPGSTARSRRSSSRRRTGSARTPRRRTATSTSPRPCCEGDQLGLRA